MYTWNNRNVYRTQNRCFNVNFCPVTLLTEPIVTNNVPIMHHFHYYYYVNILWRIVGKLFIPRNKSPRLCRGCVEAGGRERNCLGPCPRLLYTSEARPRQQGVVWTPVGGGSEAAQCQRENMHLGFFLFLYPSPLPSLVSIQSLKPPQNIVCIEICIMQKQNYSHKTAVSN